MRESGRHRTTNIPRMMHWTAFRSYGYSVLGVIVATVALLVPVAPAQTVADELNQDAYEYGPASRDGIGKSYMGREISHVMGHLGANWLERPSREREERTDLLIERLPLDTDDIVADIGAGTGYFTFPIARRVPDGKVLAVDIQPEMLDMIERRTREVGVDNVTTVLGKEKDPRLAPGSVDLILIVDAYHEFEYPLEMGQAMVAALKPGGRLILVEYRGEDPSVPIKRLHKMTEKQAKKEMVVLGLEWVRTGSFLPQQHFLVFEKTAR